MSERLLARLLAGLGLGAVGLISFLGSGWAEAGIAERVAFFVALAVAAVGIGLDITLRRRQISGGGPV
ncbi:hypothetical protein [Rubricoccus marinus]|uniref:Uncharacterized protein n=1 Tax=Rubricoccus marinus TaxID=716817 RepID=A0A259TXJ2_9BACT|nr:hypothetical protein [Rubricoccus marinus]OZC02472.1 hypothetical protein BSZ36_05450 [Rubricoccus marinus]